MLTLILAFFFVMAVPCAATAAWELIWNDEFSVLDPIKGSIWVGPRDTAGEVAYFRAENVFVQDANLCLRSAKEDYLGYEYTTGRVWTKTKFSFLYGKVEVRAKVPTGIGFKASVWMMPTDDSWPPEIDIFEILGRDPDRVYMTNHWSNWPWSPYTQGRTMNQGFYDGPDFSQDFHIFSIEWSPGQLRWLVDGVERHSSNVGVSDKEMYLIFNTRIGGSWPGYPDETTTFPQNTLLDYIRVYKEVGDTTPPAAPSGVTVS